MMDEIKRFFQNNDPLLMSCDMNSRYPRKKKFICGCFVSFVAKEASLRQSRFSINFSASLFLPSDLIERRFFYFETVFIMTFERGRYRGLQYYKRKHPLRGAPYTGQKSLRGVYS